MAVDLHSLVPEFQGKVQDLIAACAARQVVMRPYNAVRTPAEQAVLWRQSRSKEEIDQGIQKLRLAGAPFLADCIEQAGPQHGDPVTNAMPGLSWHQWAEAVDCVWVVGDKAEWSTAKKVDGVNGYRVYAEEAVRLGLTAGGNWTSFKDWPHVQLRAQASPDKGMSLAEIDAEMRRRFG